MLPRTIPPERFRLQLTKLVDDARDTGAKEVRLVTGDRQRVVLRATTVLAALNEALYLACRGDESRLDGLWGAAHGQLGQDAIATTAPHKPSEPNEIESLFVKLVARAPSLRQGSTIEETVESVLTMIVTESDGLPLAPRPISVLVSRDRCLGVEQAVDWNAAMGTAQSRALAALRTKKKRDDDRSLVSACFRALGYSAQLGKRSHAKDHRADKKAVAARREAAKRAKKVTRAVP